MKKFLVATTVIIALAMIGAGIYAGFDRDPNTEPFWWACGGLVVMAGTVSVAKGGGFLS